jgi:thiopeptide-type bacteriocin biosynthesis protein
MGHVAAHHLTPASEEPVAEPAGRDQDPVLAAVRVVLSGIDVADVAAEFRICPAELADALDVFVGAGGAALAAQRATRGWLQMYLEVAEWNHAEQLVALPLGALMAKLQESATVAAWWFIRKAPCWRLRCRPGPQSSVADLRASVGGAMDDLINVGCVRRRWETCYEPETLAFGGPAGMGIAHRLFHADSTGVVDYLRLTAASIPSTRGIPPRREVSLLLCNALLSAARLEWYERADVWDRVAAMRPMSPGVLAPDAIKLAEDLNRLFGVDASPDGGLYGTDGPLAFAGDWVGGFHVAGKKLGDAATQGSLGRGLRDALAYHIIFHWNRIGLPDRTQSILAHAARIAILGPGGEAFGASAAPRPK